MATVGLIIGTKKRQINKLDFKKKHWLKKTNTLKKTHKDFEAVKKANRRRWGNVCDPTDSHYRRTGQYDRKKGDCSWQRI